MSNYQVVVVGLRGERIRIDLCNTEHQMRTMTVLQLKEKIKEKLPQYAGEGDLRLYFSNRLLDRDDKPLSEYGIKDMSEIVPIIHLPPPLCLVM